MDFQARKMDTAVDIHPKEKHFTFDKIPDLTGKVAVVTGGNAGIGYITCRELARKNAYVFLLGRNIEKGQAAIEKINSETGNQNVEFLHLNLKNLKSVKECAENFLAKNLPLHILINNAGITTKTFSLTDDGIQEEFGVNHVGHFLFTKLLLPKIKVSQPARIVNVSSRGHFLVEGGIEFEKLSDPNAQDATQRYSLSKLANILFTNELNVRYLEREQIYANSLHPGLVDTHMSRKNDLSVSETFLSSLISTEDGAITTLYCATSPEIEEKNYRGRYFDPFGIEGETSSCAKDDDLAKKLWDFTENLINKILSQE
ncbi:NADP-binding protein [Gigaspora margarita]|uniref:NADP-binding protein n=1 Tax=Gigaspora margarita TaxID=4874 RepID=A0A8H4B030_GIGMA|nr:NADP-binding protein [Gigaspora margarita]